MKPGLSQRAMLEDRKQLASGELHSLPLLAFAVTKYGHECLEWAAETFRMELAADYKLQVPQQTLDRLMAGIAIATSTEFYVRPAAFIQLCNVMGDKQFDPSVFDPADPYECGWGLLQAMLISPPDLESQGGQALSPEVEGYLEGILDEYGMSVSPKCLAAITRAVPSGEVGLAYADDPEMFSGIMAAQQQLADEVDQFVAARLAETIAQLDSLQLIAGSGAELVQKLRKEIADHGQVSPSEPAARSDVAI